MAEHRRERPGRYRPAPDMPDEYDAPAAGEDDGQEYAEEEDAEYDDGAAGGPVTGAEPDVFLDVPALKVEEIHLEVDDLSAQVSLHANVLDLLKLHVGAEVTLGQVLLDIKGVDAAAQLKVRLDKVAAIINRVMKTIDDNPQILSDLTRGLGEAASGIGSGAAGALDEVGRGAGRVAGEIGGGAGSAVESAGGGVQEAADNLGERAGQAVEGVTGDGGDEGDGGEGRPVRRSAGSRRQERAEHRGPTRRPPARSGERPRRARHDADGRLPRGRTDGPQASPT